MQKKKKEMVTTYTTIANWQGKPLAVGVGQILMNRGSDIIQEATLLDIKWISYYPPLIPQLTKVPIYA